MSLDEDQYVQLMESMQDANECCGFGPPQRCYMPDYQLVPDVAWEGCPVSFDQEEADAVAAANAEASEAGEDTKLFYARCPPLGCGRNPGWYVPTVKCEQIVVVGMREFMGGCRYLYPMGKCAQDNAYNKGCGSVAQEWAYERVASMASIALNCVVVNVITTFIACCLCFKRRDEDVLPPEFTKASTGGWLDESKMAKSKTPYLVENMFVNV